MSVRAGTVSNLRDQLKAHIPKACELHSSLREYKHETARDEKGNTVGFVL